MVKLKNKDWNITKAGHQNVDLHPKVKSKSNYFFLQMLQNKLMIMCHHPPRQHCPSICFVLIEFDKWPSETNRINNLMMGRCLSTSSPPLPFKKQMTEGWKYMQYNVNMGLVRHKENFLSWKWASVKYNVNMGLVRHKKNFLSWKWASVKFYNQKWTTGIGVISP